MTETPTPPTGVHAVMADGREIPLECVYDGWDGDCHRWLTTPAVVHAADETVFIKIRMMPAHTAVRVTLEER